LKADVVGFNSEQHPHENNRIVRDDT